MSRRAGALLVGLVMETIGIVFALAFAILSGDPFPSAVAVGWSLLAGLTGIVGLLAFYRALVTGAMSLVAPVAAVVGAGLPVLAGYAFGERLGAGQVAGIIAALAAVGLVSRPASREDGGRGGIWLALFAGLGFAAYFVGMDRAIAAGSGPWWPVPIARASSIVLTFAGVLATGQGRDIRRVLQAPVIVAGVGDVAGNLGFLLARSQGTLGPAAVVASLYPAVTVILAWLLLDERLSRAHLAGVGLAFAGIVLIALPG
jgi:drug/metabolite transporter (DMT)-like permease